MTQAQINLICSIIRRNARPSFEHDRQTMHTSTNDAIMERYKVSQSFIDFVLSNNSNPKEIW